MLGFTSHRIGGLIMDFIVWCVSWYDITGERHIEWNVQDPWDLKEQLIKDGIQPDTIEVYEKDVS